MMAEHVYTNHPFTENQVKDKPIHIKDDLIAKFIYPDVGLAHSDLNYLYLSTNHMTVVVWEISPGGQFDPPDYHPGDEVYFILGGTITELNPTTGEVLRAKKDEALLIPKQAVHIGYNFETEVMKNFAVIAPKSVESQLFPTDADPRKKLFYGKDNHTLQPLKGWEEPLRHPTVDNLGSWPADADFLRKTGFMYHIPEEKKLFSIWGDLQNPILVKTFVSNDFVHVGEFFIPSGGTGPRQSDPIAYANECFLYCLEEPLTVYVTGLNQTYVLKPEEGLYLPPKTEHVLLNYNAAAARVLFSIAPGTGY